MECSTGGDDSSYNLVESIMGHRATQFLCHSGNINKEQPLKLKVSTANDC